MKSRYIPDTTRKQILLRDSFKCQKCGENLSLEVHHINPVYKGGNDLSPDNLVTLCCICNHCAPNNPIDFQKYISTGCNPFMDNIDEIADIIKDTVNQFGSLFEKIRKPHIERIREGRVQSLTSGGRMGRPMKNIPIDEMYKLLAEGVSKSEIARKFKVHRTTIYRKLKV